MSDYEKIKKTKKIENFIGVFDNYFSESMIDAFMDIYKHHEKRKEIFDRASYVQHSSVKAKDKAAILEMVEKNPVEVQSWLQKVPGFTENFLMAYKEYLAEVPINEYVGYQEVHFEPVKIQKTSPGEGYHVWHIEAGYTMSMLKRVIVYTIYLNDIEEGGETEFLYQHVRVKPKKGRLVIWPAPFPFVHRGNPPLKEDKYILTSWLTGDFKI